MEEASSLEVFADVSCPFAHVGLRAVVASRTAQGRDDVALVVRSWPLELVNGTALDPATTAAHVRELREQVAPDLFRGFDAQSFPATSLPALALAELGYRRDARTGEGLSLALRDALFEEGRDIASAEVLAELAARFGLDAAAARVEDVRSSWREGQARGVRGSPHFFCSDRDAFCPTLDIRRDEAGHLALRRQARTLEAFLAACFSA